MLNVYFVLISAFSVKLAKTKRKENMFKLAAAAMRPMRGFSMTKSVLHSWEGNIIQNNLRFWHEKDKIYSLHRSSC